MAFSTAWPTLFKHEAGVNLRIQGKVAEWSKALALGASPKGRGFEPHLYHTFCFARIYLWSISSDRYLSKEISDQLTLII